MINNEENTLGMKKSYWIDSTEDTNYETLNCNIDVDVAIVGGGITGITSALLLQKEGLKVAVFEAGKIAYGTTGHTTAKITSQHGLIYSRIVNTMGKDMAAQYAKANETAIKFIKNTVQKYNIDCDFKECPSYIYTEDCNNLKKFEEEMEAIEDLDIKADYLDTLPLPLSVKGAIRFNNQAQFHPRKYILSLASKISQEGVKIFENTKIVDVIEGRVYVLKTENNQTITASKVIIASHYPFHDGLGFYFARLLPSRSYVLGMKIKDEFPDGMFISYENPKRSLRSQDYDNNTKLILVGGDGHETGCEEDTFKHYKALALFAESKFNVESILYRWSAQDYITVDGVPYAGHLTSKDESVFVATGYAKWGMTNSTASSILIKDLILEKKNEWKDVYNPSRYTSASTKNFIELNFDIAKNLIKGKLKSGDKDLELKKGEGKIVEIDGKKYGAYRDDNDKLHIVDSTCTHFGCELKWNEAEKTWDCPCHGSRFSVDGEVIEGPAFRDLKHLGEGKNNIDPDIF